MSKKSTIMTVIAILAVAQAVVTQITQITPSHKTLPFRRRFSPASATVVGTVIGPKFALTTISRSLEVARTGHRCLIHASRPERMLRK